MPRASIYKRKSMSIVSNVKRIKGEPAFHDQPTERALLYDWGMDAYKCPIFFKSAYMLKLEDLLHANMVMKLMLGELGPVDDVRIPTIKSLEAIWDTIASDGFLTSKGMIAKFFIGKEQAFWKAYNKN